MSKPNPFVHCEHCGAKIRKAGLKKHWQGRPCLVIQNRNRIARESLYEDALALAVFQQSETDGADGLADIMDDAFAKSLRDRKRWREEARVADEERAKQRVIEEREAEAAAQVAAQVEAEESAMDRDAEWGREP